MLGTQGRERLRRGGPVRVRTARVSAFWVRTRRLSAQEQLLFQEDFAVCVALLTEAAVALETSGAAKICFLLSST